MTADDIKNADNATLDAKIIRIDRRAESKGYPFKLLDEMTAEPAAKRWLVKGILARGETSAWIAPPGGMKSALLASASIAVASGVNWLGKRTKVEACSAGVVYFALERADLVERRLRAHRESMGIPSLPIAVVSSSIELMKPDSFKRVVETIRDAETAFGAPVGLIVFDTFAKLIAAGGGDENLAKDQGLVFASIQRIKNNTDAHIAIIGHTGKDESRGARGSNAFLGDVDVMVTITGDVIRTAAITKANDLPEGTLFAFKSVEHAFGTDEDGEPITVNIVSDDHVDVPTARAIGPRLSPNAKTAFGILQDAGNAGLEQSIWNDQLREAGIGTKRAATLNDIRRELKSKGLVREYNSRWTANST